MVTDFFGTFLQELGALLQIPDLHPDANNSCLIKFKDDLLVQLELDRQGQYLIVGSNLGEVPVGRYRENLFIEALKANGLPTFPHYGTFAYSKHANQLVLFEMFPVRDLSSAKLGEFLPKYIEKAKIWKEAIARGDVPIISTAAPAGKTMGMFGLRP